MAGESGIDFDELHGTIMIVAWFGLTQIAVWATFLKQYHLSIYVHIAVGAMVIVLVAVGSTVILTHDQFDYEWNQRGYHNGLGAILFYIIPILLFSGAIAKYTKGEPAKPVTVKKASYAHRIIGWIFILASRVPLYTGYEDQILQFPTIFFIVFDFVSYLIFWLLKLKPSSVHTTLQINLGALREVSKEEELGVYGQNYFIFANIVYPIEKVLSSHPGGFTVIDKVRGRQVDRFIYGGQFIESYSDNSPHSHSTKSLTLADEPLAEIKIRSPYLHMGPLNSVVVEYTKRIHSSTDVHLLYLSGTDMPFEYEGYKQIEQLGRFYSLTANSKMTRLYSPVNFATRSNLDLMKRILGDVKTFDEDRQMSLRTNRQDMATQLIPVSQMNRTTKTRELLPLLIKKYPQGRFTPHYLEADQELTVSQPLGFGLSLASYAPGKIIMFSGGTGFYPFSDLVDLLFKSSLVEAGTLYSKQIVTSDPILSSKPFENYTFELYCSVRNINDIHPVSLSQMNKLGAGKQFKCILKADIQNKSQFKSNYSGIQLRSSRFQDVISELGKKGNKSFSGILVCGPGGMSNGIVEQLIEQGIHPSKWRVL